MERLQRLVEEPVQVEHVGAASGQERSDDGQRRVAALNLAPLQVDEYGRALRRILRLAGKLADEAGNSVPDGHAFTVSRRTAGGSPESVQQRPGLLLIYSSSDHRC